MLFPDFKQAGVPEIVSILAGSGLLLLLLNYILNYLPLSLFKGNRLAQDNEFRPISVIICAKNEEDHLTEFLPKVLSQNYPEFEVIVVNDCSDDSTESVIDEFAKIFPNLRKATIKEDPYYKHGKKFAMLVGIKAATHKHLVFTDADCYPASEQWLQEMALGFTGEKVIVLGYGAYEKGKGFLNKLIRFDTFMIAVQYFSATLKSKPYMGVGRNLAYTSDLFFKERGFSKHYHIQSGDDDLFVNQVATGANTNVCLSSEGITYSQAKTGFKQWNIQKTRHLSTAPLYSQASKARIAFNYFTQYFFYIGLIPLAFSVNTLLLIPILLVLKIVAQVLILNKASKRLNERDLLAACALYELILLFIYPIFQVSKLFYKPNTWTN